MTGRFIGWLEDIRELNSEIEKDKPWNAKLVGKTFDDDFAVVIARALNLLDKAEGIPLFATPEWDAYIERIKA